jgi:hypothetical protein
MCCYTVTDKILVLSVKENYTILFSLISKNRILTRPLSDTDTNFSTDSYHVTHHQQWKSFHAQPTMLTCETEQPDGDNTQEVKHWALGYSLMYIIFYLMWNLCLSLHESIFDLLKITWLLLGWTHNRICLMYFLYNGIQHANLKSPVHSHLHYCWTHYRLL